MKGFVTDLACFFRFCIRIVFENSSLKGLAAKRYRSYMNFPVISSLQNPENSYTTDRKGPKRHKKTIPDGYIQVVL